MKLGETQAILTVKNASTMSPFLRNQVARWLRKSADALESEGANYSGRFRARFIALQKASK